jgi:hypothetical protein
MKSPLAHLTDEELVEQVPTERPGDRIWQQAPYLLEMLRREIEATRQLHQSSTRQANVMIVLTVVISILTGVLVWKGL